MCHMLSLKPVGVPELLSWVWDSASVPSRPLTPVPGKVSSVYLGPASLTHCTERQMTPLWFMEHR